MSFALDHLTTPAKPAKPHLKYSKKAIQPYIGLLSCFNIIKTRNGWVSESFSSGNWYQNYNSVHLFFLFQIQLRLSFMWQKSNTHVVFLPYAFMYAMLSAIKNN